MINKEKIVVFLDILGFKQLSLEKKEQILEYVPKVIQFDSERTSAPLQHQRQPLDCKVYIVSDSIIITLEEADHEWQNLFDRLIQVQYDLFVRFEVLIRGGISYGQVLESFRQSPVQLKIIGEAYEDAYDLSEGRLKSQLPIIQIDPKYVQSFFNKTFDKKINFFSPGSIVELTCAEREIDDGDGDNNNRLIDFGSCIGLNWVRRSLIKGAAGTLNLLISSELFDDSFVITAEEVNTSDLSALIERIKFKNELNFIKAYISFLNQFQKVSDPVKIKYRWVIKEVLQCLIWHSKNGDNSYKNIPDFIAQHPKDHAYYTLMTLLIQKSIRTLNNF